MKNLVFLIGVILLLPSCSQLNQKAGLQDDNLIEEVTESLIKEKTGADIDLTPSTPEVKQ